MVEGLRLVRGYVRFRAAGGYAERLIGDCARAGLRLWDIAPDEFGFIACIRAADYRALTRLARRSRTKVRLLEKRGARFVLHRNRRRWGLFWGAAGAAAMVCVLSLFVWSVRIEGAEGPDEALLREQLAALGVREGVRHASIEADTVERRMLVENDELAWIAVNVDGSTVTVKLKKRVEAPGRAHSVERPANIVALYGGIVREVACYTGQEVVQPGQTVAAGDLLISGIIEYQNGKSALRRATGKVLVEHTRSLEVAVPLREEVLAPTGEVEVRRGMEILGRKITLRSPPKGQWRIFERSRRLTAFGVELPVVLRSMAYELLAPVELQRSEEEARQLAEEELLALEAEQLAGAEVLERSVTGKLEEEVFLLRGHYLVLEDVGVQRDFAVQ